MMTKPFAAFFGQEERIAHVYAQGRREQVGARTRLYPAVVGGRDLPEHLPHLDGLEVIFSTWGMPTLSAQELERLPSLRAVFYAAGSVQGFARPLLERDITLVSAWHANAVPVAEFTLAQILLAGKAYWRNTQDCRAPDGWRQAARGPGNFGGAVAVLGAGAVGRALIRLLGHVTLKVLVFDPFLSDAEAAALGAEPVTLAEAFTRGQVVTNHLANKPETVKMLGESLFGRMPEGAAFINTGRGATVDEDALIRVLRVRPDLTALLDVTDPEPPAAGSSLYALPNVHLTSHIAGALGDEVVRMADLCLREFDAWQAGEALPAQVTLDMLDHLA